LQEKKYTFLAEKWHTEYVIMFTYDLVFLLSVFYIGTSYLAMSIFSRSY